MRWRIAPAIHIYCHCLWNNLLPDTKVWNFIVWRCHRHINYLFAVNVTHKLLGLLKMSLFWWFVYAKMEKERKRNIYIWILLSSNRVYRLKKEMSIDDLLYIHYLFQDDINFELYKKKGWEENHDIIIWETIHIVLLLKFHLKVKSTFVLDFERFFYQFFGWWFQLVKWF